MYALALFALPMIIGNLFQQTYTMVDSAIVGRYVSEQALAAVGASYSLTNVFICLFLLCTQTSCFTRVNQNPV